MDIELMDVLNILSFYIGLINLEENLSQDNASKLLDNAVQDIHQHLKMQDSKLDLILERINKNEND